MNERRNPTLCADTGFYFLLVSFSRFFSKWMTMQRATLGLWGRLA